MFDHKKQALQLTIAMLACGAYHAAANAQIIGYALTTDNGLLERIDLGSGESDQVGVEAGRPFSGLAFDPDGNLWTVDSSVPELVQLNLFDGSAVTTRDLDASLNLNEPDLTFDPCGRLYVLDRPPGLDEPTTLYGIASGGQAFTIGIPERRLRSISSTEGRLVALAISESGQGSLVDIDRATGVAYFERTFEDSPGDAWIDFEENGTLWGIDPARDFGPPRPARGWTAAPRLALRAITSELTTATDISGLALAPPQGNCSLDCAEGQKVHCFQDGRFAVTVEYTDGPTTGSGTALINKSVGSGLFTFFDETNWEVMVKVLDACAINQRFWVFSSAATDLPHEVVVTDTATGAVRSYRQPAGPALAITDTNAFDCSTGGPR